MKGNSAQFLPFSTHRNTPHSFGCWKIFICESFSLLTLLFSFQTFSPFSECRQLVAFSFSHILSLLLPFYPCQPWRTDFFSGVVLLHSPNDVLICVFCKQIHSSCTKRTHISCVAIAMRKERMNRAGNGKMESFMVSFCRFRVCLFRLAANKLSAYTDGSRVELNGKKWSFLCAATLKLTRLWQFSFSFAIELFTHIKLDGKCAESSLKLNTQHVACKAYWICEEGIFHSKLEIVISILHVVVVDSSTQMKYSTGMIRWLSENLKSLHSSSSESRNGYDESKIDIFSFISLNIQCSKLECPNKKTLHSIALVWRHCMCTRYCQNDSMFSLNFFQFSSCALQQYPGSTHRNLSCWTQKQKTALSYHEADSIGW